MKKMTPMMALMVALLYGFGDLSKTRPSGPPFRGSVLSIADGDTITVAHRGRKERIRLFGVDCPERRQEFGSEATRFTVSLVGRRSVTVIPLDRDRYGRTVGIVVLPDGRRLNHQLVSHGFAWWARRYAPCDVELAIRELCARIHHRGLWSQPDPTPPWAFRHGSSSRLRWLKEMLKDCLGAY